MNTLVLQLGRDVISLFVRDSGAADDLVLQAGPAVELPAARAMSNRDAWIEVLPHVQAFLKSNRLSPDAIRVVPLDVEVEVLRIPRVKGVKDAEIIDSQFRLRRSAEASSREILWCPVPEPLPPSAEGQTKWFVSLTIDRGLGQRLREIPSALGRAGVKVEIVPYPLAATRCLGRSRGRDTLTMLDVGAHEACLLATWQGVPVRYTRFSLGIESLIGMLCTRMALEDGSALSMGEAEAEEFLTGLDLSRLRAHTQEESTPFLRQLLQGLLILLEKLRSDVSVAMQETSDAWSIDQGAALLHSPLKLEGLDAFIAMETPGHSWEWLDTEGIRRSRWESDIGAGLDVRAPVSAIGLAIGIEDESHWEEFRWSQEDSHRWWRRAQLVLLSALAVSLGVLAGLSLAFFLGWRSLQQPFGPKAADAGVPGLEVLGASRREALARFRSLMAQGATDSSCRDFLAALSRKPADYFCLDQVSVIAAGGGQPVPEDSAVVLINGRAGAPDRELQDFLAAVSRGPNVEQATLENVEQNADPGLSCRFQIRVKLKAAR